MNKKRIKICLLIFIMTWCFHAAVWTAEETTLSEKFLFTGIILTVQVTVSVMCCLGFSEKSKEDANNINDLIDDEILRTKVKAD